jgi:hypothetical protein
MNIDSIRHDFDSLPYENLKPIHFQQMDITDACYKDLLQSFIDMSIKAIKKYGSKVQLFPSIYENSKKGTITIVLYMVKLPLQHIQLPLQKSEEQ